MANPVPFAGSRRDGRDADALRPVRFDWDPMGFALASVTIAAGRSLRACLDLGALGERSLLVDCDVLQADAGTRTAAVTGSWLALAVALQRLQSRGVLSVSPLRRQVAAVSVGLVGDRALLDLDYSEDSRAAVDLNVVGDGDAQLLEIQGTAEGAPFSRQQLHSLLDLAEAGIAELQQAQRQALAALAMVHDAAAGAGSEGAEGGPGGFGT